MAMERMTAWRCYARNNSYNAVTILGQDDEDVLAMVSTAKSTFRMRLASPCVSGRGCLRDAELDAVPGDACPRRIDGQLPAAARAA